MAVAHGYLIATREGYAQERHRFWSGAKPRRRGLTDLAHDMAKLSGSVVHGASPDGPMAT